MPQMQRVLVGGAIFRDGRLLLLRRLDSKKFFPGNWEIPGGKVDFGESPETAVLREIKEETGLDAKIERVFHTWSCIIERKGVQEHCVEIDFLLSVTDFTKIQLSPDEHSEFKWVSGKEMPKPMSPEMTETVKKAILLRNA